MKKDFASLLRRLLPVAAAVAAHFALYYLPKLILGSTPLIEKSSAIDRAIPFVPFFIVFYIGAYIQWGLYYLRLFRADGGTRGAFLAPEILGKLVCAVLFVVFPITLARPEVTGSGVFAWATRIIYAADTPMCLFPSIHCLQSYLTMRCVCRTDPRPWRKALSVVFSVGVFLSTVLVKQHLFADVVGGILLAELCLRIAPLLHLPEAFTRLTDGLASRLCRRKNS